MSSVAVFRMGAFLGTAFALVSLNAHAFGRRGGTSPDNASSGKTVIELAPMAPAGIELPDESLFDVGENFQCVLTTDLPQSGGFILVGSETSPCSPAPSPSPSGSPSAPPQAVNEEAKAMGSALHGMRTQVSPSDFQCGGYDWGGGPSIEPAAIVNFSVDALSFASGEKGDRMLYGFNEHYKTPYNDGSLALRNEFPLRTTDIAPNWFDNTFNDRGTSPFDSQSGLDLGDGLDFDVLYAWLTVKYAHYDSELHLTLNMSSGPEGTVTSSVPIQVHGSGYFFDVVAGYQKYSLGIAMARSDAMQKALNNAISGSMSAISSAIQNVPKLARVDNGLTDPNTGAPVILLGTGPDSEIPSGTRYSKASDPSFVLEVTTSCSSGSLASIVSGDFSTLKVGDLFQEVLPASAASSHALAANTSADPVDVELPAQNLAKTPNLDQFAGNMSWLQAFYKSVVESLVLPYRIWRYFQYDQAKNGATLASSTNPESEVVSQSAKSQLTGLATEAQNQGMRAPEMEESAPELYDHANPQMGMSDLSEEDEVQWYAANLTQMGATPVSTGANPIVAVIDSGIDYNHPMLRNHIWLNPDPGQLGFPGDDYGWDFISDDSRPYDDGYHGTEVASVVAGIAPQAQLMALKVFNPFGITQSSAMLAAFHYAVDHGAQVILCAWAARPSAYPKSIEMGVSYARDHGVLVVAAAGDRGSDIGQEKIYPGSLSGTYANVLTVANVDSNDQLVAQSGLNSSYSSTLVGMAAHGQNIRVADPRSHQSQQTSTGYSAALVAGAAVGAGLNSPDYIRLINYLQSKAQAVSSLESQVKGGLRLKP